MSRLQSGLSATLSSTSMSNLTVLRMVVSSTADELQQSREAFIRADGAWSNASHPYGASVLITEYSRNSPDATPLRPHVGSLVPASRFSRLSARVVKLVDTSDLKSAAIKKAYGFDSRSGHHQTTTEQSHASLQRSI